MDDSRGLAKVVSKANRDDLALPWREVDRLVDMDAHRGLKTEHP